MYHLVVSNNLSKTVAPEVVKGFDSIFQEGVNLVGALATDDTHSELKKKFEQREFQPGKEAVSKNLLVECIFWYQGSSATATTTYPKAPRDFSLLLMAKWKFSRTTWRISLTLQFKHLCLVFVSFLENAGYRQIDANAVKVNIVTLHSHAGVIIHPEEDVEMIRENERKAEKKEKRYFDPSFM